MRLNVSWLIVSEVLNMKRLEFSNFRQWLIDCEFSGDIMCMTWAFLQLTDKQVDTLKSDVIRHARTFIAYPDGSIKVDCYTFK